MAKKKLVGRTVTKTTTNFFLVPAPGYYGDSAIVMSSHATLEAAREKVGKSKSVVVRQGHLKKGDKWLRVYEETYKVADG